MSTIHGGDWRKRARVWTPPLLFALSGYLDMGMSDGAIATRMSARFGRSFSADAIKLARKRHGLKARSRRKLTARAVARLLGIPCSKAVTRWIEQGWLKARQGPRIGPHRHYMVDYTDLLNFLRNEDHWHRWQPERIADRALRTWMLKLRGDVRYLTVGDVAERCCVVDAAVNDWIHRGLLPAVRNGNWMIRASDLLGFIPPGQQPKTGMLRIDWTTGELDRLARLRAEGWTFQAIANELERSVNSVANRWYRLNEQEHAA